MARRARGSGPRGRVAPRHGREAPGLARQGSGSPSRLARRDEIPTGYHAGTDALAALLRGPTSDIRKMVLSALGTEWTDYRDRGIPPFPPALRDEVVRARTDPDPEIHRRAAKVPLDARPPAR